jgi:hypothetical protein
MSRKITCKHCRFQGVIEAHDTQGYPPNQIFKSLGKDREGYLHFLCPSCSADKPYSPYSFFNPTIKIVFYAIVALVIWGIIKCIGK